MSRGPGEHVPGVSEGHARHRATSRGQVTTTQCSRAPRNLAHMLDVMRDQSKEFPMIPAPTAEDLDRQAMKNRVYRCDDETFNKAAERADRDGVKLAEVIRFYLREYGAGE